MDPFISLLQQGLALQKAGRVSEAEQVYRVVVNQAPQHSLALHLAGTAVGQLGRLREAIDLLRRSLALNPTDPVAWNNLATAQLDAGSATDALDSASKAIALAPAYVAANFSWGSAASQLGRYSEAVRAFQKVLTAQPYHTPAWMGLWRAAAQVCDWAVMMSAAAQLTQAIQNGQNPLLPFDALIFADDPVLHLQTAQAASQRASQQKSLVQHAHTVPRYPGRIRLAYLSADFHEHATAYLMAVLFERHDRQRFEVIGISFGPDDESAMRARLRRGFDQFWDVCLASDEEVFERMLAAQIDIAVDLKGFTHHSRPSILLRKPAPIVVNYLGYPGTTGSPAHDYLIGDRVVTPLSHAAFYSEKLVQMPCCYQVNDSQRLAGVVVPTREEEGLPEDGFVFAAFNNVYKITPDIFAIWMRLLAAVPGSVIWLLSDSDDVRQNLRMQAKALGMSTKRLVFGRRVNLARHLARHVHAGLFLDTFPCNAHTTTSDALWMGLPVVTCVGQAFAGRVAASLLYAVSLPELVTQSLLEYESLALRLASDPHAIQRMRDHLLSVRATSALFDSARFADHLESAFEHMFRRWQQGLPAKSFDVSDLASSSDALT